MVCSPWANATCAQQKRSRAEDKWAGVSTTKTQVVQRAGVGTAKTQECKGHDGQVWAQQKRSSSEDKVGRCGHSKHASSAEDQVGRDTMTPHARRPTHACEGRTLCPQRRSGRNRRRTGSEKRVQEQNIHAGGLNGVTMVTRRSSDCSGMYYYY